MGNRGGSELGFGFREIPAKEYSIDSAAGGNVGVGLASRFPRGRLRRRVVCAGARRMGGGGRRRNPQPGKSGSPGRRDSLVNGLCGSD